VILLLGGTSETAPLSAALAEAGHSVLVSTATDVPMTISCHPNVRRRIGRLDEATFGALVGEEAVRVIVDATHPYAVLASRTAFAVAIRFGIPYLRYSRPSALTAEQRALHAPDHESAAHIAVSYGRPVLLTIGTRNLDVYAKKARERDVPLVARVLDHPDSLAACRRAGLEPNAVIAGRGPFSAEQNRKAIRSFGIGVLVTKDSGEAGGACAKLQAVAAEGCLAVVVDRPSADSPGIESIAEMTQAVSQALSSAASAHAK
jgi:precorrin-6A/cobalt-precorrin-6A reductase